MAFTPLLNLSLSDSPPDKPTLISLAGSGFVYDGHETIQFALEDRICTHAGQGIVHQST